MSFLLRNLPKIDPINYDNDVKNEDTIFKKIYTINDTLQKTLKASGILILYNLIESTVRRAIEQIHIAFSDENLSYNQVIDKIQMLWIEYNYKNFKEYKAITIHEKLQSIGEDIIKIEYEDYIKKSGKNDLSGNVDAMKIRNIAEKYAI